MNRKKKGLRNMIRILLLLAALVILTYAGIMGYVCIREGRVATALAEDMNYDAIIVLGAQVYPNGEPSVQLAWRLDKAAEAYALHGVPVVVCGAQGGNEPCTEAEVMKRYLTAKGIPEGMILEDPDSFNTNENLENAQELLNQMSGNICRVLIVTSDYHVPRALAIAGDLGYKAEGLGSPCKPEYWLKNHAREALAWCKYWAKKHLHLPL